MMDDYDDIKFTKLFFRISFAYYLLTRFLSSMSVSGLSDLRPTKINYIKFVNSR